MQTIGLAPGNNFDDCRRRLAMDERGQSYRPAGLLQSPAERSEEGVMMSVITVQSPEFSGGQAIPTRHAGDGEDSSPMLTWRGVPAGTQELALICDDPDAPTPEPWVHWVIYKIPAETVGLPQGIAKSANPPSPKGAIQGINSWGTVGYRGPAPPRGHGQHRYHFKLYALDTALNVTAGLDKDKLLAAMSGHVLAEGELIGTYER